MSHVQYSRLPTNEIDDQETGVPDGPRFDYSSAFSYGSVKDAFSDGRYSSAEQLKESYFDYPKQHESAVKLEREIHPPTRLHKAADWIVIVLAVIAIILTSPISCWFCFKKVQGHQRALVYRLGRKKGLHEPGLMLVIPFLDQVTLVDVSTRAFNVPPQMVCTADRAIVQLGAELQYSVRDAERSVTATQDSRNYLRGVAQTVLVKHVSGRDLKQVTNDRLGLSYEIQKELGTTAQEWGLTVDRVELSHVQVLQEPDPEASGIQALLSSATIATPPGMPGFPELMGQMISSPHMQKVMSALNRSEAGAQPGMKQVMDAWSRAAVQQPREESSQLEASAEQATNQEATDAMPTVERVAAAPAAGSGGMCTMDDLIGLLKQHVTAERCQSVQGCINLTVNTGAEKPALYHVDLRPDSASVGADHVSSADATLQLSAADLTALVSGQLSAASAYFSGQLQVTGDLQQAICVGRAISEIWETCVLSQLPVASSP